MIQAKKKKEAEKKMEGLIEEGSLFVGLDCSTQAMKACVVNEKMELVLTEMVNYDSELAKFKTKDGVHRGEDGLTVTSPTLMWLSALDKLFEKLKQRELDFGKIKCISGEFFSF